MTQPLPEKPEEPPPWQRWDESTHAALQRINWEYQLHFYDTLPRTSTRPRPKPSCRVRFKDELGVSLHSVHEVGCTEEDREARRKHKPENPDHEVVEGSEEDIKAKKILEFEEKLRQPEWGAAYYPPTPDIYGYVDAVAERTFLAAKHALTQPVGPTGVVANQVLGRTLGRQTLHQLRHIEAIGGSNVANAGRRPTREPSDPSPSFPMAPPLASAPVGQKRKAEDNGLPVPGLSKTARPANWGSSRTLQHGGIRKAVSPALESKAKGRKFRGQPTFESFMGRSATAPATVGDAAEQVPPPPITTQTGSQFQSAAAIRPRRIPRPKPHSYGFSPTTSTTESSPSPTTPHPPIPSTRTTRSSYRFIRSSAPSPSTQTSTTGKSTKSPPPPIHPRYPPAPYVSSPSPSPPTSPPPRTPSPPPPTPPLAPWPAEILLTTHSLLRNYFLLLASFIRHQPLTSASAPSFLHPNVLPTLTSPRRLRAMADTFVRQATELLRASGSPLVGGTGEGTERLMPLQAEQLVLATALKRGAVKLGMRPRRVGGFVREVDCDSGLVGWDWEGFVGGLDARGVVEGLTSGGLGEVAVGVLRDGVVGMGRRGRSDAWRGLGEGGIRGLAGEVGGWIGVLWPAEGEGEGGDEGDEGDEVGDEEDDYDEDEDEDWEEGSSEEIDSMSD